MSHPNFIQIGNNRNLLLEWQEKITCKRKLHLDAYYHYSKINTAIGIAIIILSSLTGAAGLGTFHLKNIPIPIIIGVINICTAILSSVQHFCKFSTKAHVNEKISIDFSNLNRVIETILVHDPIENKDVEDICQKYNTIMNNETALPRTLLRQNSAIKKIQFVHT